MAARIVESLLDGYKLTLVDIGARNETLEIPMLAPYSHAFGFEPNPAEYEKLVGGQTDRYLVTGEAAPRYLSITYHPAAVHDSIGEAKLFITRGPGASGLLEPNFDLVNRLYDLNAGADALSYGAQYEVVKTAQVPTTTLDAVADEHKIRVIDFLKIDTECSEYQVLSGAKRLLSEGRISVIKTESEFSHLRHGQKTCSDIGQMLESLGFRLIGLSEPSNWRIGSAIFQGDRGLLGPFDAFFVLSPEVVPSFRDDRGRIVAAGISLMALGFYSVGADMLHRYAEVPMESVQALYAQCRALRRFRDAVKPWLPPVLVQNVWPAIRNVLRQARPHQRTR